MTLTVGIDPSTKKIAIAAEVDEPRLLYAKSFVMLKPSQKQDVASLGAALCVMRDFVQWADSVAPDGKRIAWVEDPIVGRGGVTTTMKQAYVGGIIRAVLHEAGFEVHGVNVSTWKKTVVGNGHAEKVAVRQTVCARLPKFGSLAGDDGDLYDAGAILLHAKGVQRPDGPVRRPARPTKGRVQGPRPRTVVRKTRLR